MRMLMLSFFSGIVAVCLLGCGSGDDCITVNQSCVAAVDDHTLDCVFVIENWLSEVREYAAETNQLPLPVLENGKVLHGVRFELLSSHVRRRFRVDSREEEAAVMALLASKNSDWESRAVQDALRGIASLHWTIRIPHLWQPHRQAEAGFMVGPGAAFDRNNTQTMTDLDHDTILLMSVAPVENWLDPKVDFVFDDWIDLEQQFSIVSADRTLEHIVVGFADGTVWRLRRNVPFDVLRPFISVSDSNLHDRNSELGKWISPL